MKEATTTANGQFNYADVYHGKSLDAWVQEVYHARWQEVSPVKGDFRYDSLAMSIAYVFVFVNEHGINERHMCMAFHQGWLTNYTYWCDWVPWLDCYTRYIATEPLEPLQPQNVPYAELKSHIKEQIIHTVQYLQDAIKPA